MFTSVLLAELRRSKSHKRQKALSGGLRSTRFFTQQTYGG